MRVETLEALKRDLIGKKRGVVTVLSSDFAERKAVVSHVSESFGLPGRSCLAEEMTPELLKEALFGGSLFASEELIHIEGVEALSASCRKLLEEENLAGRALLISGSSLSAATNLYKRLVEIGTLLEYGSKEKPKEREARFLKEIAAFSQRSGTLLSKEAATALVKEGPEELSALLSELEKLTCYVLPRKEISLKDVQELASLGSHGTIWQLTDRLLERSPKALSLVTEIYEKEGELIPLLRALRLRLEKGLKIASLLASGEEVTKEFPYLRGFILDEEVKRVHSFGEARLKKGLVLAQKAEWDAKNGASDPLLLLQKLIVEVMY